MRLLHAAALTGAALLLASVASAQGLGDAAAKEKQKRKASPPKQTKTYTEDNIGRSMAPVSSSDPAASADASAQAKTDKTGAAADKEKEKATEDPREKAQAEWRQKLEQAHKEEAAYQEMVNKVQLALNDTSSLYGPGRAANLQLLEENQKKLAETRAKIASLEEEGRRNAYR